MSSVATSGRGGLDLRRGFEVFPSVLRDRSSYARGDRGGTRRAGDLDQEGRRSSLSDAVRKRFGEPAELIAELEDLRAAETQKRLRRLLTLTGEERALDVGTGAFAIALAPFVREVVGVDIVPELLEEGRKRAPANVELVGADSTALPYERGSFDLVCTARTLHHVQRPELVLAEMNRVLRPGGTMLVVDQLAPIDSLAAIELNRFERARDPSTTRILAEVDLRGFFEANGLVLRQAEIVRENRDLERYLDLAGCHGDERERPVAPRGTSAEIGWYVVHKPGF